VRKTVPPARRLEGPRCRRTYLDVGVAFGDPTSGILASKAEPHAAHNPRRGL